MAQKNKKQKTRFHEAPQGFEELSASELSTLVRVCSEAGDSQKQILESLLAPLLRLNQPRTPKTRTPTIARNCQCASDCRCRHGVKRCRCRQRPCPSLCRCEPQCLSCPCKTPCESLKRQGLGTMKWRDTEVEVLSDTGDLTGYPNITALFAGEYTKFIPGADPDPDPWVIELGRWKPLYFEDVFLAKMVEYRLLNNMSMTEIAHEELTSERTLKRWVARLRRSVTENPRFSPTQKRACLLVLKHGRRATDLWKRHGDSS